MTTQISTLSVPELGAEPDFDEFVDAQFRRHSDFLDEEKSLAWEAMTSNCDGEWNPADDFHNWWQERCEQLRAELWEEWIGLALIDPWERLNEAQQENETLHEQVAGKDRTIKHLQRRNRKLKQERTTLEESLYHKGRELEVERGVTTYMREENRCRHCNGQMFGN